MRARLAATVAAACAATLGSAPAAAADDVVTMRDCVERRGFVTGDDAAIRARVPDRYELTRDRNGRALLVVQGIGCGELEVGGDARPTTQAHVFAAIRSPDGAGCLQQIAGSADPTASQPTTDVCNVYPISWAADHPGFVEWLERGTPEMPAAYVPSFGYELRTLDPLALGAPFRFEAGAEAPSPFVLEGVARERGAAMPVGVSFWLPVSGGQLRMTAALEMRLGDASGTLTAAPGSELERLLGERQRPFERGYGTFGGANRWAFGEYRKAVVPD